MRESRVKAIYDGCVERLKPTYSLGFVGYQDNLDDMGSKFQECIDEGSSHSLYMTFDEYMSESKQNDVYDIIEDICLKELGMTEEAYMDFKCSSTQWFDELRNDIEQRDNNETWVTLLEQTDIDGRIEITSSYEAAAAHYAVGWSLMEDEYLVQLMTWLSLNPAKLKQTILTKYADEVPGRWPNIKSREGKEVVDYADFCRCYLNTTSYSQFCFFGRLPLNMLDSNEWTMQDSDTIPKGTTCTFFSSWIGSGSIDIKTKRDITISQLKKNIIKCKSYTEGYDDLYLVVDEKGCKGCYSSGELYGQSLSTDPLFVA